MNKERNYLFMYTLLFLLLLVLIVSCGARTSQVNAGLSGTVAPVVEPALPKSITAFVPDTSPMPDALPWFEAAKSGDHDAQFVVGMMYRDKMPGLEHIVNGQNSPETANYVRESMRWLHHVGLSWYVPASYRDEDPYPEYYFELNKSIWSYLVYGDLKIGWRNDFYYKLDNSNPIDMGAACTQSASTLKWLETAAAHGYSHAELVLGLAYYKGVCVKADKKRGLELIQRAALHDKTNATACYYTGMMYELGIGQNVDKAQANAWLHLAADNGSRDAQFVMGLKYLDGIDVYPNDTKASQYIKASETEDVHQKKHLWSGMLSETIYKDSSTEAIYAGNDEKAFSFRDDYIVLGTGFGMECQMDKLLLHRVFMENIYRDVFYADEGGDEDACYCDGPCGLEYCKDDEERTQEEIEVECCVSGPEWCKPDECDKSEYVDDYQPHIYMYSLLEQYEESELKQFFDEQVFEQEYEEIPKEKAAPFLKYIMNKKMNEWIDKESTFVPEYVTDYDILNQWLHSVVADNHLNAMMMRSMVLANDPCGGKLTDEELQKWGPDEVSAKQTVVHQYLDTLRSKQYPNIQYLLLSYYLAQKDEIHTLELLLEAEFDQHIREIAYDAIVVLMQSEHIDSVSKFIELLKQLIDKYPQAISILDNILEYYAEAQDVFGIEAYQEAYPLIALRIDFYKKDLANAPESKRDIYEKIGDLYYETNKYMAYKYYQDASKGLEWSEENAKLLVKKKYLEYIIGKHYYDDGKKLNNDDAVIGPDDHMKLYESEEELQELVKEDSIFRVESDNRSNARKWLERAIEEYDQYRTKGRKMSNYSDYGAVPMMLMRLYGTDVLEEDSGEKTNISDPDMEKIVHCLRFAIKYYNSELDTDRVTGGFTIRNILNVILSWDIKQGNETQQSYYRSYYNICDNGFGLFDAFVRIDGDTPKANKVVNENKLNCYKQLYSHCERDPHAPSSVCDNTRNYIQSATASSIP